MLQLCGACRSDVAALPDEFRRATRESFRVSGCGGARAGGAARGRQTRKSTLWSATPARAQVTQQALAMVVARWGGPGGCPEAAARAGRPGGAVLGRFNDRFAAKRPKFEWSTETGFLSRFSAMCGWSVSLSEDAARRRRCRRHPCWVGLPIGGREHRSYGNGARAIFQSEKINASAYFS